MKIKDLKIGRQLTIGFSILLLLVMALGFVSHQQTNRIHRQTELIYNHPLKIRTAIGEIGVDVNQLHWAMETALSFDDYEPMKPFVKIIKENDSRIQKNLAILEEAFLGSPEYIEELRTATSECKENRDFVFHLIQAGNWQQADKINIHTGTVLGSEHLNEINGIIEKISGFTLHKAKTLQDQSHLLNIRLRNQLLVILAIIIIIVLIINYTLLKNIRTPLSKLTGTARRFGQGDMSARSLYKSKNELGVLAGAFNTLAENIQTNMEIDAKTAVLTGKMLSEDDAQKFFKSTLEILMKHAGAQLGAVYLLNENESTFDHFVSIGIDAAARKSFTANEAEGEFGAAVQTRKIHYIKDIPEDTRFRFQTVGGSFVPHEIITIPIVAGNQVTTVISLASVNRFSEITMQLIDKIYLTYCARVEGILAYRQIREFSEILAEQNRELEAQKMELSSQSAELTEQNRELEIQKNQLSEANRLKTSFLSNMSHELRTPLNSVIALSGVLNRRLAGQIPDEEYSYLEVIERNGRNLLYMINDILDIARIESGREDIEITEFQVCDCIDDVAGMIRPQAEQKKIALNTASGDCQTKIAGDVDKARHILQNLIGNAVKFTQEGSIDISVRKLDDTIEICVSDTGIGIEASQLPHIFDEFRQVESGNSRHYEGTGLGLAIAKKYARLLGGNIRVESIVGQGSKFTLTLPLVFDADNKTTGNIDQPGLDQAIAKKPIIPASDKIVQTILLVEDSEAAVIQIQDFLQSSGYKTLIAHDGNEALQILSHSIPDAIILDLMMPGIDGFEVLRILRNEERTAHIPVLILTAKQITKEELNFLKRNKVYQLIQKGDVKRTELLKAIQGMTNPQKPEKKKPKQFLQPPGNKPKILVVEDNPDNMIAVKALLGEDYILLEAENGETGVQMTKQHLPDLVLMDISLPKIDGVEAFKTIRKDSNLKHIPIIALTANALKEEKEELIKHGFDAFIAKPIDKKTFHQTIKMIIYGKQ